MGNVDRDEFERITRERLQDGEERYGPAELSTDDMLEEALHELEDLSNYAFMEWQRIKALRRRLRVITGEPPLEAWQAFPARHRKGCYYNRMPHAGVDCLEARR